MQYHRSSRSGDEREVPLHPQDFPKIARESGFCFTLRRGRVDWQKIDSINIDRLVQECDLTTLQDNLINVVNYNLDREYDVKILDHNFVKLFKLAQLSIDYLLYSEQHLFNCIDALYKENLELKNELSVKENCKQTHQIKTKSRKKYGHQPFPPFSDHSVEYAKCHHCGKTFLSGNYLSSHILRRHPNAVLSDQSTDTNVLRAEIDELKSRLKFTEQMKHDNQSRLDVGSSLKDWQANLQEQYRGELITIKNMFVNEFKKLQETKTRSDVERHPSNDNKDLMEQIQRQVQELITMRAHIQDKSQTSPELDTLRGQLEAQERFWKSRLNEAQSKHTEDIANLKAQLSELSKANETQNTLQDLVKHTKEHDKRFALQAERISKISQLPSAPKANNCSLSSNPPENCLIDLEGNSVAWNNNTAQNLEPKTTVQSTVSQSKNLHQHIAQPLDTRLPGDMNRNMQTSVEDPASQTNSLPLSPNLATNSLKPDEDQGNIVREMSFSDTSSFSEGENGNGKKLNVVNYFPTKVLQAKQLQKPISPEKISRNPESSSSSVKEHSVSSSKPNLIEKATEIPTRSADVPIFGTHSSSLSKSQEVITTEIQHQTCVAEQPKNETHAKTLTPGPFVSKENGKQQHTKELKLTDTEDSTSGSSDDSGTTITEDSAARDGASDLALHSIASLESALAKNPQILAAFKEDIVEQFENRLRELAVDPQWQGIPTANYNKNLATLQHHESIAAKKFKSFFEIKQTLGSRLDDRLGLQKNVDNSGNQPQTRSLKSDKLFKNIPGAKREAVLDERSTKISSKKPPPRPPSLFPKKDQSTLSKPHTAKSPTFNNDSVTPFAKPSGSRIVTSTPMKEHDTRQNVRTRATNLVEGNKAPSTSSPLRRDSFDGDIDSLLDESLKSPKRRFSNPMSKSQDFLVATPKLSREISPRSALKGALSTGSLVTKKRVVFSDQDQYNLPEKSRSIHTSKNSAQVSDKFKGGAGDVVDQTDQDSYTDSDFDLSSNQEDLLPMTKPKETVIKLSTQQSNKIAQISHSIETQLRDASRLKPAGGIEAMFHGSHFNADEKTKAKDDITRITPVPQPRKSEAATAKKESDLFDDWDLEDLDDLLAN